MSEQKNLKIYPNAYEAEQSLLCCILKDGEVASDVIPCISEDYFYNKRHRTIFAACRALFDQSRPVDVVTVNDKLEASKQGELNMMEYLVELTEMLPSTANYSEYIELLKRDLLRRKMISACNEIIEKAYNSQDENEIINLSEKLISDISAGQYRGDLRPIGAASSELLMRIDNMSKDRNSYRGLMTHFPRFDFITGGLQKGDLIILAARPSVGKTSFALNIVSNIIAHEERDKVIAIFSLEMPSVQLAQRVLSTITDVSMTNLGKGNINENQQQILWAAHSGVSESKVFVDDTSQVRPADVMSKCRRLLMREKHIDLIVIDYLQLMTGDRLRATDSKQNEIGDISRMMKILAKEMNCPVIVLSQMSRGIENRDDKTPKLSDLRESGAIEQDADLVLFLAREDENSKGRPEYNVILDLAKHRNGELGAIRFLWEGANVRFTESKDQYINRELNLGSKQRTKKEE